MLKQIYSSVMVLILITLLTGFAYPYSINYLGNTLFAKKSEGSLLKVKEKIVGSKLLGQDFNKAYYLHGRPRLENSFSCGTNLSLTNKTLIARVNADAAELKKELGTDKIPGDLIYTSGSNFDPHISLKSAELQAPRIAKYRGVSEDAVRNVILRNCEGKQFGFLGDKVVNVLKVNVDLDTVAKIKF